MRDYLDAHVSQVNEFGSQENVDGIYVTTTVRGSFRVRYWAGGDRVVVEVEGPPYGGDTSMQLTLDQAILLRELLDAGITDALTATAIDPATAEGVA